MIFERIKPGEALAATIEYFWTVAGDEVPVRQKIVPDGCPELIFHFGDLYRIKIGTAWQEQARCLLAGQLTRPIFVENSGRAEILGIKFKPAIPGQWFSLNMTKYTNDVVALQDIDSPPLHLLADLICAESGMRGRIACAERFLGAQASTWYPGFLEQAVDMINHFNGSISVTAVCHALAVSERKLERAFASHVGISPKQYSRVIRFRYLFDWIESGRQSWVQVGLRAGFYDQSHFIREFKAFTGEEPSGYSFDSASFGNFLAGRTAPPQSDLYNTM